MAQRRMFSLKITNSARFLRMPIDSQLLYFHLGLHADDDGVVEAYTVLKMLNSNEDNLNILVAKGFIKVLNEDLVSFITDWGEHNLIRADRKVDSIYKNLLLKVVSDVEIVVPKPRADTGKVTGRPMDNQWTPQDRIGKDSISKEIPSELPSKEASVSPKKKKNTDPVEVIPFDSKVWISSLLDSPQLHINLIGSYFLKYADHNFPTKEVASAELKKNLKPAMYLVKNFKGEDITKTLRHCQDNFSDVNWNLHTVQKQITHVTAKK